MSRHLLQVVDRVPETHGSGVVLIDFGRMQRLRTPLLGMATVVFERRMKPVVVPPMLARPGTAATRGAQAPQRQRTAITSPATEWINLGLNCGGAALAWIGVAGLASLAPATGGLSGWGAAMLYGGAAASTGQCVVSVARVANVQRGRADVNRSWDANRWYVRTMLAADVVGLVGAGGALKELKATNAVLRQAGFSFTRSTSGEAISRPMRRALTTALDLQGGRRVPGVVINRVVRQRLMDGVGGVIGLFASSYSGALGEAGSGFWDLVVWITEETGRLFMIRRNQDYWQRLRKDRRSNWAAGFAGVAIIAATVSLIGLLVEGSQYQARGNPLYWALMLPVVWWLSGLGGFEPRAVRWWKPVLLLSVVIAGVALVMAVGRADWAPEAVGFAITLLSAATSLILLRGSLVDLEGPAR